jgi:threonine dehydrogenase-like Zn-dependent dehydrogenase
MLPFGTFTERGIVREHGFSTPYWLDELRYLFRVPGEIADVAVLTEPISVAEKGVNEALAIQRGRLGPAAWSQKPPRVLVTGQGPIAFACVLVCRCLGWPTAVCGRDEPDTFRAQLAQRFGATYGSSCKRLRFWRRAE